MWFLQLWANAIFKPFLQSFAPANLPQRIDGPRLCYLHRDIPKTTLMINEFFFFLKHLHQLSFFDTIGMNLSPYNSRTVGPSWFTCSRIDSNPIVKQELNEIWSNFLCCHVFLVDLPDSKNKNVELHNPSFKVRQFVFSQAILAQYSLNPKVQLCGSSVGSFSNLEYFSNKNEEKHNLYSPLDFENSFLPTPSFIDW